MTEEQQRNIQVEIEALKLTMEAARRYGMSEMVNTLERILADFSREPVKRTLENADVDYQRCKAVDEIMQRLKAKNHA